MPAGLRVPSPSSSAGPVVHLSVAIGRFFEALLYAMLSVAFRVLLEILFRVATDDTVDGSSFAAFKNLFERCQRLDGGIWLTDPLAESLYAELFETLRAVDGNEVLLERLAALARHPAVERFPDPPAMTA